MLCTFSCLIAEGEIPLFRQISTPISLSKAPLLSEFDLKETPPPLMDLDEFHQPTPAIRSHPHPTHTHTTVRHGRVCPMK